MKRLPAVLCLLTLAASWAYLAWWWPRMPDTMPMQWDAYNRPTWTAPKATFVAFTVVIPLAVSAVVLAASLRVPGLAWIGAGVGANALFLAHVCVQAARPAPFLPVPVNVAVLVVLASALIGLPWLAWRHRRAGPPR